MKQYGLYQRNKSRKFTKTLLSNHIKEYFEKKYLGACIGCQVFLKANWLFYKNMPNKPIAISFFIDFALLIVKLTMKFFGVAK